MAALLFVGALELRFLLFPVTSGLAFITFYPAVVVSFYLCGIPAGALVAIASAITGAYFFISPDRLLFGHEETLAMSTFLFAAFLIGLVFKQVQIYAEKLISSEHRYQTMLETASDGIHILDEQGNLVEFSDAFARILGYTKAEAAPLNVADWDAYIPKDQLIPFVQSQIEASSTFETKHRRKDGTVIDVEINATGIELDGKRYVYASTRDITERKETERKLQQVSFEQQAMLDNELIAIVRVKDRHILWKNKAMGLMFGYPPEELLGKSIRILYQNDAQFQSTGEAAYPILNAGHVFRDQLELLKKGGEKIWVDSRGVKLPGEDAVFLWTMADITALKQHEAQVTRIAHHDILTGLPNRLLLDDRLSQAIAQATRAKRLLAVCYLDLDGFKPVNDTFGHEAGDTLLKEIARRMQDSVRTNDTVARLGGDEFVLLLTNLVSVEEYQAVLDRIVAAINQPISLDASNNAHVTASIGITVFPFDNSDPDALLRHADQAMYLAKNAGRNRVSLFATCSAEHTPLTQ